MANSIDAYFPEIWANETLAALQENFVMANLFHRDFEPDIARFGDTVNTRKPTIPSVTAKSAWTDYVPSNATSTNIAVVLDKQYYVQWKFDDVEVAKSFKDLTAEYIEPAAIALARQIESDVSGLFNSFTTNVVSCGTSIGLSDIASAWQKLATNGKQPDNLFAILHPEAVEDLITGDSNIFIKANEAGDAGEAMRRANLGEKLGFKFYTSVNVPKITSGVSPSPEVRNFFGHRNALALVTRPLPSPPEGLGVRSMVVNIGGVGLRATTGYDVRAGALLVTLEVLYGVKELYDELGCLVKING